jgi:hypothetical protein
MIEKDRKQPSHMRIKSMLPRIRELYFDAKDSPENIAHVLDLDVRQVKIVINKMRS